MDSSKEKVEEKMNTSKEKGKEVYSKTMIKEEKK